MQLIPSHDYQQAQRPQAREPDWFALEELIDSLDSQIKQAARAGDVEAVRRLRAQRTAAKRKQAEGQARAVAPVVEAQRRREARRPRPGERTAIRRERGDLSRRITALEKTKKSLLLKDGDVYVARAEEIDEQQRDARARIGEIDARLAQIGDFEHFLKRQKAQQAQEAREKKHQRQRERNHERMKEFAKECAASLAGKHAKRPFLAGQAEASRSIASRAGHFCVEVAVKITAEQENEQ